MGELQRCQAPVSYTHLDVYKRQDQQRTVSAVLHDLDQVRAHFPETLLMARSRIAWGQTAQVLTTEHLRQARQMAEAWDEQARLCAV